MPWTWTALDALITAGVTGFRPRVKIGGQGVLGPHADERGRRRHGHGVFAGELALALGQGDRSAVPGGEGAVEGDHEGGGLRIGYRGDGRDDLPGALHDKGGAETQQLVTRGDDRAPDVARREHDQLGRPVQCFQVVHGQRPVVEPERGEERVAEMEAPVRRQVRDVGPVERRRDRRHVRLGVHQRGGPVDRRDRLGLGAGARQARSRGHHGVAAGATAAEAGAPQGRRR